MGITKDSLNRIERYIKPEDKILIIGCQNCYWTENYGEIAQDYFRSLGHEVKSIDIYACNGADVMDLREDLHFEPIYDLVLQHGTVEHVDGSLYQPFKNLHEACKGGGIMIHENPKTGNWPLHGQHYFTKGFFAMLSMDCSYRVMEYSEEAAMGNTTDGWNTCIAFRKDSGEKFITEKRFKEIYDGFVFTK